MEFHQTYTERLGLGTPDEVFDYLRSTLKSARPTSPSYFVNWEKALANTQAVEMSLHQLDFILGKQDMELALFELLKETPRVVEALPIVFASRAASYLLVSAGTGASHYEFRARSLRSDDDIRRVVAFCREIGLLDFVRRASITSFTDFVFGVEVGIDTNGRKNRGGKQMEESVEEYIRAICQACNYQYIAQASASQIERCFGRTLQVDRVERRLDFAVNTSHSLYLIETNYYDGGGSKLKATAAEYKGLYDVISASGHQFIWITDGAGWNTALKPLRETFDYTAHILNLEMVAKGTLNDLLSYR